MGFFFGGGGGGGAITSATVTLTDAQIKTLPTAVVQLVPAPGSGKFVYLVGIFLSLHLVGAYTNVGTAQFIFDVGGDGLSSLEQYLQFAETNFLQTTGDYISNLFQFDASGTSAINAGTTPTAAANKPLTIGLGNNTGNLTGGNAANTLKVTVLYQVVSV